MGDALKTRRRPLLTDRGFLDKFSQFERGILLLNAEID